MNPPRTGPPTPRRFINLRQGFTLVEMVVVVTLTMVIVGTVAPRLQPSPSLVVHRDARLLATRLELARTHALSQRAALEIVFDETLGTYTAYEDHDGNGTIARNDIEMWAFQDFGERELNVRIAYGRGNASMIPGDPSGDAVTLTGNTLGLNTQGIPDPWGTMGTVYLVHRDNADAVGAVSISASGSFKAWRWHKDEGEWR